jgi:hypothetical protein
MITAAKPSVNQEHLKVLRSPDKPLYTPKLDLALFFSAKSGCTWAVKWFFYQTNLLDAALFYHPWIHTYRMEVFYKSNKYKNHLHKLLTQKNNKIIKVARNPYNRAVSSYLHACKLDYEDEKISSFLGREVDQENKFTFEEFVNYLSAIDLRKCNVHHKIQVHPAEEHKLIEPTYIVKLENSLDDIRRVESELNLKQSNYNKLKKSAHHTSKVAAQEYVGDRQFTFTENSNVSVPSTIYFYNDKLQQSIAELYQIDFEHYDYDINHLPEV